MKKYKKVQAVAITALLAFTLGAIACTQTVGSMCGVCTGSCTYLVICGLSTDAVSTCTGTSNGAFDPDCEYGYGAGGWVCLGFPSTCGASVVLTGTCCGGARTTTTDWSPTMDSSAVGEGCT